MTDVQAMMLAVGCDGIDDMHWAGKYDDLKRAWDECDDGARIAYLLIRIGFDVERVTKIVLDAAKDVPWLDAKLRAEFVWRGARMSKPEIRAAAAYSIVVIFCRDSNVPCSDVAQSYRDEFSFDEVATAIATRM